MNDPTPEVDLTESAASVLADLGELVAVLPGDANPNAAMADRLSEELSEVAAMLRAMPGRPVTASGSDWQLLSGLRSAHAAGEDVAETIARACARLAHELGGAERVLSNRSGSWEAGHIRALLEGTCGLGDDMYRTTQ